MCGIMGYMGPRETAKVLIDGLRRLEYRGYDSAGVAIFQKGKIEIRRKEGKLARLEELIGNETFDGRSGIGHTRRATNGRPSDENAHPHKVGRVAVVHNGIIENYLALKDVLKKKGHRFKSETDTEIISHLIDEFLREGCSPLDAVRKALDKIKGSYALVILIEGDSRTLIAAKKESPLVLGLGEGEYFIASDVPPLLPYTRDFVFLEDGEVAVLSPDGVKVFDARAKQVRKETKRVEWNPLMAEKGGYKHFMLKEIFEQPRAVIDTIRGRLLEEEGKAHIENIQLDQKTLKKIHRVFLIACGTSSHAGLGGKFLLGAS